MTSPLRNIALIGADGHLGPSILAALSQSPLNLTLTILKRASSSSSDPPHNPKYPNSASCNVRRFPDSPTHSDLVHALSGQDALICAIPGSQTNLQINLANAALEAGVRLFVPADFGSCDSESKRAAQWVDLYGGKKVVRAHLESLVARQQQDDQEQRKGGAKFSWTALVCGHFFDWDPRFLHIFLDSIDGRKGRVDVLDEGEVRFSASTLAQVGRATCRIVERYQDDDSEWTGRNKVLFVQSFCVTQGMVLEAVRAVRPDVEWEVRRLDSAKFVEEERPKANGGDKEAVEELVWVLGTLEADWEGRENFAMKSLGLEEEDLREVLKGMIGKG